MIILMNKSSSSKAQKELEKEALSELKEWAKIKKKNRESSLKKKKEEKKNDKATKE